MMSPARVNLNLALEPDDPSAYNRPGQPIAVLLQGRFPSALHNRYLNDFALKAADSLEMNPIKESTPTRMVVVADGDIIRNDVSRQSGDIFPLGYDRYSRQIYGNKVFLQNTIDYLVDREGLLNIRSRQIRLRLLDSEKVKSQQLLWQLFNLGLPIGLLFIFGGIRYRLRVRKFGQKHPNYA
jgi:ABC-2 type transport system permease protein